MKGTRFVDARLGVFRLETRPLPQQPLVPFALAFALPFALAVAWSRVAGEFFLIFWDCVEISKNCLEFSTNF